MTESGWETVLGVPRAVVRDALDRRDMRAFEAALCAPVVIGSRAEGDTSELDIADADFLRFGHPSER